MEWQEIRKHYPQQWLLVEAIKAYSEANVSGTFRDRWYHWEGLPHQSWCSS
jgi:hypothetical protein